MEWKGTQVSTWEREETLLGAGAHSRMRQELSEARTEREQPFNLYERLRIVNVGEAEGGRGKVRKDKQGEEL